MDERELLREKMRATPRRVTRSILCALALAAFITSRILWTYQQSGKPLGRGLMYAGLIAFLIVSNSLSLLSKNKFGYVVVLVAAVMNVLGSFALSLHAMRLIIVGDWAHDQIGIVTSVIGLLQLIAIIALMINLLSRDVREWVWKPLSASPALT